MKYIIYILLFLNISVINSLSAQNYNNPYKLELYPFISDSANHLTVFGDSTGFDIVYKKLDSIILTGKGNLNIVHFGGSHIQAGIWPGRIRLRFQHLAPGMKGALGFVFPYRIAQINSPYYYWIEYTGEWESCRNVEKDKICDLGVGGISVTTTDTLSEIIIHKRKWIDYPEYYFNRIKVIHDLNGSYDVDLNYPDSIKYHKTIDSLGGISVFRLNKNLDTLKLIIKKNDSLQTHFTLYGIILENDDPGIVYHSFGINGASVPSYLRCNLFNKQLQLFSPDLAILSIGINDAYGNDFDTLMFEHNYDSLITKIRSISPNCAIILTTNNDSYVYHRRLNRNGLLVRRAMFRIAERYNAGVWDMFSVMGGLNSIVVWQKLKLAKTDKIHFTQPGYILIGDLFFNAFLKSYDKYIDKKNNLLTKTVQAN
ncbi:MAG: GDSL-type esterase/lipase family protein [Marinilabiliales bacterium]